LLTLVEIGQIRQKHPRRMVGRNGLGLGRGLDI
jgi:hypothetical protein